MFGLWLKLFPHIGQDADDFWSPTCTREALKVRQAKLADWLVGSMWNTALVSSPCVNADLPVGTNWPICKYIVAKTGSFIFTGQRNKLNCISLLIYSTL